MRSFGGSIIILYFVYGEQDLSTTAATTETMMADAVQKTTEGLTVARTHVTVATADAGRHTEATVQALDAHREDVACACRDQEAEARALNAHVQDFFTETYKLDTPTGTTPRKQSWAVKEDVTITRPHRDLLAEFRSEHATPNGTFDVVSDDTDGGDSVVDMEVPPLLFLCCVHVCLHGVMDAFWWVHTCVDLHTHHCMLY